MTRDPLDGIDADRDIGDILEDEDLILMIFGVSGNGFDALGAFS
tara:strand:- start:484 stop:615 length:132 start_codon:yes stop_codon:yes gene_type:complete